MNIELKTDVIKEQENNIAFNSEQISVNLTLIYNLISSFSSYWQGEDFDNYLATMSDFITETNKIVNSLDSCVELLKNYYKEGKTIDEEYASKTVGLI